MRRIFTRPRGQRRWPRWLTLTIAIPIAGAALAAFTSNTGNTGNAFGSETLDPPTALTAVPAGKSTDLSWTATVDTWADGYEIWRSSTPGCCYSLHDTVSGQSTTTYTDLATSATWPYSYVVRATASSWSSDDSNEATCCTVVERVTGWTTGLTHTTGSGSDRLLVFVVGMENATDRDATVVTYGGQALTEAVEEVICSTYCARTEIWYLDDAGIDAASSSTFVVTWGGTADDFEPYYGAITLEGVDQSSPIGPTGANGSTTSNPIQITTALAVDYGDMVVVGATSGNWGSYTPDAGYSEGFDQRLSSSTAASSYHSVIANGTQQPSMDFDYSINRQTIVAVVVQHD